MDTMQDLINQCRQRLNIENSDHVTDNELKSYMNYSLAELYEILVFANEQWNIKRISFTTTNSVDGYKLPEDFWRPLVIGKLTDSSSGTYYPLSRINIRDESYYNSPRLLNYGGASGYDIEVRDGYHYLKLVPFVNSAGQYNAVYYPHFQDFNFNDEVVIGQRGQKWTEYAIADVCLKVCLKDETDPSGFIMQKQAVKDRIAASASARDAGQAEPPPQALPWWDRW